MIPKVTNEMMRLSSSDCCTKLSDAKIKFKLRSRTNLNDGFETNCCEKVKCKHREFGCNLEARKEHCCDAAKNDENILHASKVKTQPAHKYEQQGKQKGEKSQQADDHKAEDEFAKKGNIVCRSDQNVEGESGELDEAEERELMSVLNYDTVEMCRILRNMGFSVNFGK
ncbi:hypothetical protein KIN20_016185 [Parelaphostrongylus tenuis]|uniref:Uncharacterized protein n=1 Tax=Parelaphostrongylus tenuis TaxID=148309 RepID=A0AAD5QPK2_PARTN|nr:hypothetical protein KIN20_016185 [Parelaphostrongylus tenuis]